MAAGEPGILIDDPAQPVAKLVIGALPQGPEGPRRGDDGIVVDPVAGADLRDAIGHAGAAGDAVDQALGPFQHAMEDALGRGHLPQHVHMDAALAAGDLMGDAGLIDAALDRIGDELLMALAPGLAVIGLLDELAVLVEGIGIDAGEGADAAARGPGARTLAVGDRDTLAALDQREDLAARDDDGFQRLHDSSLSMSSR